MTINSEEVVVLVRRVWPNASLARPAVPLTGGFWASMFRLELVGQPTGVPAQVVLRVAPDQAMGAKELAVQQALADLGYATPAVRAKGVDDSGRAWALMDYVDAGPLLAGLDGVAALRRAPTMLRTIPETMGQTLARLHAVDPEPVTAAVRSAAPSVAWQVEELLARFEAGARALDRLDLAAAVEQLAAGRPVPGDTVVCHGDFHPFNLLAAEDGAVTVIDWTGALLAEPAFDLAFTTLLLAHPPLDAPRPLAALIRPAGALLARRFLASYRSASAKTIGDLEWYRAVHSARILIEAARVDADGGPGGDHPFVGMVGTATAALQAQTGRPLPSRQ